MQKVKRYKRGEHQIYDDHYDRYLNSSEILNPSERPHAGTFFWTKENIKIELIRLSGADEKGQYKNWDDTTMRGEIPVLQEKLENLEIRFEQMNIERGMRGQLPYDDFPPDMLAEKFKLEARLDVCLSEKQLLESRLKENQEHEEQSRKSTMLQYGLRCQMSGNEIDGQKTEMINDTLVIVDAVSPYHGMSVVDYRKLSANWLQQRRQADKEKLLRIQAECKEKGLPVPTQLKASSIKTIDKRSLPLFPKEYNNYLQPEKAQKIKAK